MNDQPLYGQRAQRPRQEICPRHPGEPAVAYCKRCNRPACPQCAIQTEVGSICVDCASGGAGRKRRSGMFSAAGSSPWSSGAAPAGRIGRGSGLLVSARGAPVTAVLLALNIAMYVVQAVWRPVFQYAAFTPLFGAIEPWRLLTTTFLHAGFFHLLFNMLMLLLLGSSIERAFGWWRYLSIYLLSALGGSVAIIAWTLVQPNTVMVTTVGASGAIYGLFGAIFIAQRRAGMSTVSIVILLVVNLIYGFTVPGISWQAHIGGFISGLIAAAVYVGVMDWARKRSPRSATFWGVLATVVMFAAMAAGAWGLYAVIF